MQTLALTPNLVCGRRIPDVVRDLGAPEVSGIYAGVDPDRTQPEPRSQSSDPTTLS
jgi:hypothetical protein